MDGWRGGWGKLAAYRASVCENIQRHFPFPIQDLRHQQLIITQGYRAARVAIILRRGLLALHDPLEVVGNHGRHGRDGRCVFGYHGLGRNAKLELGDRVHQGSSDSIIKHTRRHLYKLFPFRQAHTHTQTQSSTHTLLTHSLGSRESARVRGVAQGKDVGVLLVLQGALVDVDEALFF